MFEQDYLMKMILQLVRALERSLTVRRDGEADPAREAEKLEDMVGMLLDADAHDLLTLAPESFATIAGITCVDQNSLEVVARTLALSALYLREAGFEDVSDIRMNQACAVGARVGIPAEELSDETQAALAAYLQRF